MARFAPAGLRFAVPVQITLPADNPRAIYWTKEGSESEYEALGTEFDAVALQAKAQTSHFSGGFVGTSSLGITCQVNQRIPEPYGFRTTIESPAFWYVSSHLGTPVGSRGALATDSEGLNRFYNTQPGTGLFTPNADRSVWTGSASPPAMAPAAQVGNDIITSFTADVTRGGASLPTCALPLVDVTCSGGGVRILEAPPGNVGVPE